MGTDIRTTRHSVPPEPTGPIPLDGLDATARAVLEGRGLLVGVLAASHKVAAHYLGIWQNLEAEPRAKGTASYPATLAASHAIGAAVNGAAFALLDDGDELKSACVVAVQSMVGAAIGPGQINPELRPDKVVGLLETFHAKHLNGAARLAPRIASGANVLALEKLVGALDTLQFPPATQVEALPRVALALKLTERRLVEVLMTAHQNLDADFQASALPRLIRSSGEKAWQTHHCPPHPLELGEMRVLVATLRHAILLTLPPESRRPFEAKSVYAPMEAAWSALTQTRQAASSLFEVFAELNPQQLAQSHDAIEARGVLFSELSSSARMAAVEAIAAFVRTFDVPSSSALEAYLSPSNLDETRISWAGPQTAAGGPDGNQGGVRLRIEGPRLAMGVTSQADVMGTGECTFQCAYWDKVTQTGISPTASSASPFTRA